MAAMPQRKWDPGIEEESSTEVIYLVIPPSAVAKPTIKPWTVVESAALAYWNLRHGVRVTPVGQAVRATGLVAGYGLMATTLLVAGYFVKSALGFDIVPGTHMGGYVPQIGGGKP